MCEKESEIASVAQFTAGVPICDTFGTGHRRTVVTLANVGVAILLVAAFTEAEALVTSTAQGGW